MQNILFELYDLRTDRLIHVVILIAQFFFNFYKELLFTISQLKDRLLKSTM